MVLIDTNILLHTANPLDPLHAVSRNALATLRRQAEVLCVAPQNLVEFWAVATRPTSQRNGLGMDVASAEQELESIRRLFHLLAYPPHVSRMWQRIVVTQKVLARQAHDAHLAAMMHVHSIESILTFNGADFMRFPGITPVNPAQL